MMDDQTKLLIRQAISFIEGISATAAALPERQRNKLVGLNYADDVIYGLQIALGEASSPKQRNDAPELFDIIDA